MSIMNPLDVMLHITTSQEYLFFLLFFFVYLQLGCTTSNFAPLPRGNPHPIYVNHTLLSVPTRKISLFEHTIAIYLIWLHPRCNHGWRVGKNLDLGSSRSLQSTLPAENYSTKRNSKSSNPLALLRLPLLQFIKFTLKFTRQPSDLGKKNRLA